MKVLVTGGVQPHDLSEMMEIDLETTHGEETQVPDALQNTRRIADVYRALTKILHPDLPTGDTVLAQQLNAARDRRAVHS